MRRISRQAGMLLCAYLAFGSPTVRAATLADPPRAEWGCELSEEKVRQGVYAASIKRGWSIIESKTDGMLVLQIIVRGRHTLAVSIAYDTTSYHVTYKTSDNLRYRNNGKGKVTVHRNVNKWMNTISKDIATRLSELCFLK